MSRSLLIASYVLILAASMAAGQTNTTVSTTTGGATMTTTTSMNGSTSVSGTTRLNTTTTMMTTGAGTTSPGFTTSPPGSLDPCSVFTLESSCSLTSLSPACFWCESSTLIDRCTSAPSNMSSSYTCRAACRYRTTQTSCVVDFGYCGWCASPASGNMNCQYTVLSTQPSTCNGGWSAPSNIGGAALAAAVGLAFGLLIVIILIPTCCCLIIIITTVYCCFFKNRNQQTTVVAQTMVPMNSPGYAGGGGGGGAKGGYAL